MSICAEFKLCTGEYPNVVEADDAIKSDEMMSSRRRGVGDQLAPMIRLPDTKMVVPPQF